MSGTGKKSVKSQVEAYLLAMFPASYTPGILAKEMGLDHEGVKKACQILLKERKIQRPPTNKKSTGWYMGVPTPDNISNIEDPPVEIHCLSWQVTAPASTPETISIYTNRQLITAQGEAKPFNSDAEGEWYAVRHYWDCNGHMYSVDFQFFDNTIAVHLNASKKPLNEAEFVGFRAWLIGILQASGVNTGIMEMSITKAELSKDYERVTITPKMLEIRDLESRSWLRIYRKYRNLHRLEIGTTWEGDKALYQLFEEFGKAKSTNSNKQIVDDGGMFR